MGTEGGPPKRRTAAMVPVVATIRFSVILSRTRESGVIRNLRFVGILRLFGKSYRPTQAGAAAENSPRGPYGYTW